MYVLKRTYDSPPHFPAWADEDYFFLPFDIDTEVHPDTMQRGGATGLGLEVTCSSSNVSAFMANSSHIFLSTSTQTQTGEHRDCNTEWPLLMHDTREGDPVLQSNNTYAAEFFAPLGYNASDEGGQCMSVSFAAWLRASSSVESQHIMSRNASAHIDVGGLILACRPAVRTGRFEVSVDITGRVLSRTEATKNLSATSKVVNDTVADIYSQLAGIALSDTATNKDWHTGTFAGCEYSQTS